MSIASRKAGSMVRCAACEEQVLVPMRSSPAAEPGPASASSPPAAAKPDDEHDRAVLPDDLFDFADDVEEEQRASSEPAFPWGDATLEFSAAPADAGIEPFIAAPAAAPEPARPRLELESDANPFQIQLRKSRIDDEMDLTPMVDVVFQLLIFFMVTASFALHKTIPTPTPESNQKGATQSIQSLEELEGVAILVRIDANNGIFIDDDPLTDDSRVSDALRDKMRKEQKSEIIITADSAAWHRTVVKVVDAANEVGMQKIRLATRGGAAD